MYELLTTPAIQQATWRTRLHTVGQNIYFSEQWPDAHKWARGKYFHITHTALVAYDKGYILPGGDSKNLDISNATGALKLYPEASGICYEILIGLKPGNLQLGIYIPGVNDYLLALGDTSQYPDLADPERRYLAMIAPEDSPYTNPLLKLWAIADMAAWILKLYVLEGVDFEKCVLGFRINKLRLEEIPQPQNWTTIDYFTQIRGTW
jgi:hypothetical protein